MLSDMTAETISGKSDTKSILMGSWLVDLHDRLLARPARRGGDDGADGLDHLALLPDDPALVLLGDGQLQGHDVALLRLLDLDPVGVVGQALDHEEDEVLHFAAPALVAVLTRFATVSDGRAPFLTQWSKRSF